MAKSKIELPSFRTYGNYSSSNYGAHALRFDVAGDTFWFSYQTLVAFQRGHGEIVVRQNDWGPTTGKHLNAIDNGDKKRRIESAAFEAAYADTFGRALKAA